MPVVGIEVRQLQKLIGQSIDDDRLVQILSQMGCDVEGFASLLCFECQNCQGITEITQSEESPACCSVCGYDFKKHTDGYKKLDPISVIRMELLAVRPDIFDAGGLSRAIRGYLGIETGQKNYDIRQGQCKIKVDKSVSDVRPYIGACIIKGIDNNPEFIKTIMKLQENLHWALGRNRKLASIGVYDNDQLKGNITYTTKDPDYKFIPLGYSIEDKNELTLKQILEQHPKGQNFSFLLQQFDRYPILMDEAGLVLSMPPIINSENTKVTVHTKNLFIDVTGPIQRVVQKSLNIIISSILEYFPNAECETVEIQYPDSNIQSPDFSHEVVQLNTDQTSQLLGIQLDTDQTAQLIEKMRHNAIKKDDNTLEVHVPAYRNDIIHPRDLMEDVAIAYGYHNIKPVMLDSFTICQENKATKLENQVREVLCGLGFLEIKTLMLTCKEHHFDRLNLPYNDLTVEIENPISTEQSILRTHLISGLMEIFKINIHNDLPQKLFETGMVSYLSPSETGAVESYRTIAGIIGASATYSEIKSYFVTFCKEIGINWELKVSSSELYIPGRGADIYMREKLIGSMGEVHPKVLENYHLVNPVALFELSN